MKRDNCLVRGFLALSVLTWIASPVWASTFTTIDVPGATFTEAHGINDRDEIVGVYQNSDGHSHGFLLVHDIYTSIDVPGATDTAARGINDSGDIVGSFRVLGQPSQGFLLSGGTFTILPVSSIVDFGANGINARGDIVGNVLTIFFAQGLFLDKQGTVTRITVGPFVPALNGINARREGVGFYQSGNVPLRFHGFVMDLNHPDTVTLIDVPGANITNANGINAQGEIVGTHSLVHSFFRDTRGRFTSIDVPGATFTNANGINARGEIVGGYGANGTTHGFVLE